MVLSLALFQNVHEVLGITPPLCGTDRNRIVLIFGSDQVVRVVKVIVISTCETLFLIVQQGENDFLVAFVSAAEDIRVFVHQLV